MYRKAPKDLIILLLKQHQIEEAPHPPWSSLDPPTFQWQGWWRKKVSVALGGGMLSSDAGVLLLRNIEKRRRICVRQGSVRAL
jgi:hypothetical protein